MPRPGTWRQVEKEKVIPLKEGSNKGNRSCHEVEPIRRQNGDNAPPPPVLTRVLDFRFNV